MLAALNVSEEAAETWGRGVCINFDKLGQERKSYIILKVAKAEEDGEIKKTPEDYTRFLAAEACKESFQMSDKCALDAWYRDRQEKAKRQAENEKQEKERREEKRVIERYRLEHGLSIEVLCRIVFSGRFGVVHIPCERVERHLLWLYPKEAEFAQIEYYGECAKRARERRDMALKGQG